MDPINDSTPAITSLDKILAKIPGLNNERFADAFTRGTLRVLLYAPRGTDPQLPHQQDEVYLIVKGTGTFRVKDTVEPFGEGDVLFVKAGDVHRFERLTDDLMVWALFYGPPGGELHGDPSSEIKQRNIEFAAAFERGDSDALAAKYSQDAQLFAPHSPAITGHPAIAKFWKAVREKGIQHVSLTTTEVESLGATAIETGTVSLFDKQKVIVDEGKYVVIWKHIDGRWKLHRDCWNSSRSG